MADPVRLLVVEDATIRAMMEDQRFLLLVPCLLSTKQKHKLQEKGCGRCSAKRRKLVADTMREARNCLTSLPSATRTKLKQLLNAKSLRILKRNAVGSKVWITF